MGIIFLFTLSRSMGKIFCTSTSSCCMKRSAGALACTGRSQLTLPLYMPAADRRHEECQETMEARVLKLRNT